MVLVPAVGNQERADWHGHMEPPQGREGPGLGSGKASTSRLFPLTSPSVSVPPCTAMVSWTLFMRGVGGGGCGYKFHFVEGHPCSSASATLLRGVHPMGAGCSAAPAGPAAGPRSGANGAAGSLPHCYPSLAVSGKGAPREPGRYPQGGVNHIKNLSVAEAGDTGMFVVAPPVGPVSSQRWRPCKSRRALPPGTH